MPAATEYQVIVRVAVESGASGKRVTGFREPAYEKSSGSPTRNEKEQENQEDRESLPAGRSKLGEVELNVPGTHPAQDGSGGGPLRAIKAMETVGW